MLKLFARLSSTFKLHNYFNDLIKLFLDPYPAKIFNISVKNYSFCVSYILETLKAYL